MTRTKMLKDIKLTRKRIVILSISIIFILCSFSMYMFFKNILNNKIYASPGDTIYVDELGNSYLNNGTDKIWDISANEDGSVKAYLYDDGTLILHDETPSDDTNFMMSFNVSMKDNSTRINYVSNHYPHAKALASDDFRSAPWNSYYPNRQCPPWLYEQFFNEKIKIKKVRVANKINVRDTAYLFSGLDYAEDIIVENLNVVLYDTQTKDHYNKEEEMFYNVSLSDESDTIIKFKDDFKFINCNFMFAHDKTTYHGITIDMSDLTEENFDFINYEDTYFDDEYNPDHDIIYNFMNIEICYLDKFIVPKSMKQTGLKREELSSAFFTDGFLNTHPNSFAMYDASDNFLYYSNEFKTNEDGVSYCIPDEAHTLYTGYNLFVTAIEDEEYDIDNELFNKKFYDSYVDDGIKYFITRDGSYGTKQEINDLYTTHGAYYEISETIENISSYLYQYVYERRLEDGKNPYLTLNTIDPSVTLLPDTSDFDSYADEFFNLLFNFDIKSLTNTSVNYLDEINIAIYNGLNDQKLNYKVFKNAFKICGEERETKDIVYEGLDSNNLWTLDTTSSPDFNILETVIDPSTTNLNYNINSIVMNVKRDYRTDVMYKIEMLEQSTSDSDKIKFNTSNNLNNVDLKGKTIYNNSIWFYTYGYESIIHDELLVDPTITTGKAKITFYYPKKYTQIDRIYAREISNGKIKFSGDLIENYEDVTLDEYLDSKFDWYKIVDDYLVGKLKKPVDMVSLICLYYDDILGDTTIPFYYSSDGFLGLDDNELWNDYYANAVSFKSTNKVINKNDIKSLSDIKKYFERDKIVLLDDGNKAYYDICNEGILDLIIKSCEDNFDPTLYPDFDDMDAVIAYLSSYDMDNMYIAVPYRNYQTTFYSDMIGCDFKFNANAAGNLNYTLVMQAINESDLEPIYPTANITINPLDISASNNKIEIKYEDDIVKVYCANNKGNKIEIPSTDYKLVYNADKSKVTITPVSDNITGTREVIIDDVKPKDNPAPDGGGNNDKPDKPSITTTTITIGGTSFSDMNGFVDGYPDGTLKPNAPITRAEFVKIAALLQPNFSDKDLTNLKELNDYNDLSANDWFAPYIGYLLKCKVIEGYGDKTFKPNDNITRAETSKILSYMYNVTEKDINNLYQDELEGHWYKDVIDKLVKANMLKGYPDGTIKANRDITRAEAIALINRINNVTYKELTDYQKNLVKNKYSDIKESDWFYNDLCYAIFNK